VQKYCRRINQLVTNANEVIIISARPLLFRLFFGGGCIFRARRNFGAFPPGAHQISDTPTANTCSPTHGAGDANMAAEDARRARLPNTIAVYRGRRRSRERIKRRNRDARRRVCSFLNVSNGERDNKNIIFFVNPGKKIKLNQSMKYKILALFSLLIHMFYIFLNSSSIFFFFLSSVCRVFIYLSSKLALTSRL
jgi:hypothetical protein